MCWGKHASNILKAYEYVEAEYEAFSCLGLLGSHAFPTVVHCACF